ncbi:unnamed protein product [Tuber aestivum]|uniref:Ammonium transporter AmtB-like domain-containing protein n=1 Tax=Tuber aestivum TaxID=59557 RepID=A0A292PN00_9PEZI|nr:unnamed protein product [Tuber aestivum]
MADSGEYTFDFINERKLNVATNSEEIGHDPMAWFQVLKLLVSQLQADSCWRRRRLDVNLYYSGDAHAGWNRFFSFGDIKAEICHVHDLDIVSGNVCGRNTGYGIAFGRSDNPLWGSIEGIALNKVLTRPVGNQKGPPIPELLFALYHGAFASFTASLVGGAVVQKFRIGHFLVFIFIWATFVYAPIAHWTWSPSGWSNKLGALDYAGGTAVHMSGAFSAGVYSVFFRWRYRFNKWVLVTRQGTVGRNRQSEPEEGHEPETHKELRGPNVIPAPSGVEFPERATAFPPDDENPDNVFHVLLGTTLLWIGWMGFNGGSTLGVNLRTVSALISTNLSACSGGLTWCFWEYFFSKYNPEREPQGCSGQKFLPRRLSILAFCNGVISGLITITPAAGYVPLHTAIFFGVAGAVFSNIANAFSRYIDDLNDIFAIHGVSGFVGMFLTGVFARRADIAHLDGYTTIPGGGLNGNGKQIGWQLLDAVAGGGYAAVGTLVILIFMEAVRYIATLRIKPVAAIFDEDQIVERELPDVLVHGQT